MNKLATALAKELLESETGNLEVLRIHEFPDDESAHDDELIERLYADFSDQFERAQKEFTKLYGPPLRVGKTDDEVVPLCGVLRFAVWTVRDKQLFMAVAHEDRGVPILLMLGTV